MKKIFIGTLITVGLLGFSQVASSALFGGGSGTITTLDAWRVDGTTISPVNTSNGLRVQSLAGISCLGTDGDGDFGAGTCSGGGGGGAFDFTPTINFGINTSATGTPLWLRGSPYSLFASSTSVFDNASTSQLTVFGFSYLNGGFLSLASSTLQNFTARGATTTSIAATNLTNTIIKANAGGSFIPAIAGTDYQAAGTYVTSLSVTSANGFAGSFTAGATPALTISTTINSNVLKGNGTAISSAVNGTDYTLVAASATCTNQFLRSLSAAGVGVCATVGASDVSLANLTATDGTLTFSGTYNGSTARTIGLNLGNANVWTALQSFTNANAILATGSTTLQNFTGSNATTTNATTTTLFATTASTTNFYGANLNTCNSASNALTWSAGKFGCNTIASSGGGGAFDFTPTTNFNVNTSATGTPIWFRGSPISLMASSTSMIDNASTTNLSARDATFTNSLFVRNPATPTINDGAAYLNWQRLELGNQGENLLVAGNSGSGGVFTFVTNNNGVAGGALGGLAEKTLTVSSGGSLFDDTGAVSPSIGATLGVTGTGATGILVANRTNTYTDPDFKVDNTGNVGLGTSTPYATLSVNGRGVFNQDVRANYFTATSSNIASRFPYASTTAISASNLANGCLTASSSLIVSTGSACGSGGGSTSPGGSNKQVQYNNSGSFAGDSQFIWDTTGTKFGIATSSPFGRVSIGPNIIDPTTPTFVIGNNSKTDFIIDSQGVVGVATTSPASQFSVVGEILGDHFVGYNPIASSSLANGLNISNGCFSIKGVCLSTSGGGGGGSGTVNSGTQGQTAYYASNGTAVTGTSTVFIAPNGFVGIGSSTPYGVLSVNPTRNTGLAPYFVIGSSTGTVLKLDNRGYLRVGFSAQDNGGEVETIKAPLFVSSPFATSSIGTSDQISVFLSTLGNVVYAQGFSFALGSYAVNSVSNGFGPKTRLDLKLKSTQTDAYGNDVNVQTWLDNGNVGINKTAPTVAMDVVGAGNYTGALSADGDINTNGTYKIGGVPVSFSSQWVNSGADIFFNAGTVAIGTTPTVNALEVAGTVSATNLAASSDITGNTLGLNAASGGYTLNVNGTIHGASSVVFDGLPGSGGGDAAICSSGGSLTSDGSGICTPSSQIYKHDIKNLNVNSESFLMKMRPVSFIYNKGAASTTPQYGFIAEDLAKIDKNLVFFNPDGTAHNIYDRGIMAIIVDTLQDQIVKFKALIARVTGVETKVNKLEKQLADQQKQINDLKALINSKK